MTARPGHRTRVLAVSLGFLAVSCAGTSRRPVSLPVPPARVGGFTALYHVSWTDGTTLRKARLAVALEKPDRLRMEILDPLGRSRAVLICARGEAILIRPDQRTFHAFGSGREALRALTGLQLDPSLLSAFLLGDPASAPGLTCSAPSRIGGDILCRGPGGDPEVQLGEGGRQARVRSGGAAEVLVRQGTAKSGRGPARSLHLRQAPGWIQADLEIRSLDYRLPGEDLFQTDPPAGFREVPELPFPLLGREVP